MEYFCFLGILLFLFQECYARLVCPIGINPVGNTCYSFHYNQVTWDNARSWCRKTKGNDLLVVRNDDVYNDIKGHISQTKGAGLWLGATDKSVEGQFRWVDGSTCCKDNWWIPGEPNEYGIGNEDCVIFYRNFENNVGFNDNECQHSSGFICEHKANIVCPNGVIARGNTCYSFHDHQENWDNARSWCRSINGIDLLVVRNDEVYNDIKRHIPSAKWEGFWLGASDRYNEGQLRWVDGSTCCSRNWWIPGEPNDDGDEDCLIFYRDYKNRVGFNDHKCYHLSRIICEHKGF